MTREERENLENNLKKLKEITEIAAASAETIEFYYATERIEASYELDERITQALKNATKLMEEIIKIERDHIPPWE